MPRTDRPDLILDTRLVTAALWVTLAGLVPAVALGAYAEGGPGAGAAVWGLVFVGLNGAVAAWLSAQGARTPRGIGVARVLVGIPLRLAGLAAAIAVGVLVLDLPSRTVALAVCLGEIAVLTAQSWCVLRGPSFVGPCLPAERKGDA